MSGDCLYTSGQEDLLSNMPGINRYYKILQVGMQRAGLESIRQRVMSYDAAVHCISWYSTHLVIIQYRALRIFLQTFVHMCTTMYYIHILSISMISIYIYVNMYIHIHIRHMPGLCPEPQPRQATHQHQHQHHHHHHHHHHQTLVEDLQNEDRSLTGN